MVLIDSIVTFYIGEEINPLLLGIMNLFSLSLIEMLIWRTIVIWCSVFFLWKQNIENKWLIVAYASLYAICVMTVGMVE